MSEKKRYPRLIRLLCGTLGLLGLASIAFHYFRTGAFPSGFLLFAQLYVAFLFIYVAIWGVSPVEDRLKK